MSERTPLPLPFPLGGLDRSLAYQTQPPYSTSDALNVVPQDSYLQRARGGIRPGLTKYNVEGWFAKHRFMTIFTDYDGTRRLIGATQSGIAYAPTTSGASPNTAGLLGETGRVQAVQYGNKVYFVGATNMIMPGYAQYSAGNVAGVATMVVTDFPSVDFPTGYPYCIAIKYNRMWLSFSGDASGVTGLPSRYWASKVGDELNYEDDGLNNLSAITAELNTTRDRITAMIPWFANYMVFATGNATYVLNGDPLKGGVMREVSNRLGIVDCMSWCLSLDNSIVAMSNAGPMLLTPENPLGEPKLIMEDKLPGVLSSPDVTLYDYVLGYDSRSKRVHIQPAALTETDDIDHWVLDLKTKSFWRYRFAETGHEPTAMLNLREITSTRTDLLLCCRDGFLRTWDETVATDDETNIENYVFLGPFRLDAEHDCRVVELSGTLAAQSGGCVVSIHPGNSAEAALAADAIWSNKWTAGLNDGDRPRTRHGTFYVKLTGEPAERWALEEAIASISMGGKLRT